MLKPMWWQNVGPTASTLASMVRGGMIAARKVEGWTDRPPRTSRPQWALRAGQQVFCQDRHVGQILSLLDPDTQARSFVMKMGFMPSRRVIVPVEWVSGVDKQVHLGVERHALDSLPLYRPDPEIAAAVDRALWQDRAFRRTGYYSMDITAHQGLVSLMGYVLMPSHRDRAEQVARTVPGVRGIENHLVSDHELEIEVARALAGDERIPGQSIYVHANNGVVTLAGQVDSAAVRASAEAYAVRVPNVGIVVNHIDAPGLDKAEDQRVLRPRIGQEVFGTDLPIGYVERVVISLRNRRVVAVMVRARPDDSQYSHSVAGFDEMPERHLVIPIGKVRFVTKGAVQLDVSSVEAAQYERLMDTAFTSPSMDWQSPYPYRHDDVLLETPEETAPASEAWGPASGISVPLPIEVVVKAKTLTGVVPDPV